MKPVNTLILERTDLIEPKKGMDIRMIRYDDFKISLRSSVIETSIVLFIDDNGQTKILKNRFGDHGNSAFIRTLEDMRDNNFSNGLGYGDEYFNQIISMFENDRA